jgi:HAD superfamily hydrolase (TIGR01509 family)
VDGTLADTTYLHTLAWSRALTDAGEWAPMNAIHRLVGMGGDQLVPRLLGHDCPAAVHRRADRYAEVAAEARPFPRAAELLGAVHDRGAAVVLATSAPGDELERLLELMGAGPAIDAVTTADDVERSKPAPDVFVAALAAGSVDRARALAVGDSVWDVRAARAAGLGCIGVGPGASRATSSARPGPSRSTGTSASCWTSCSPARCPDSSTDRVRPGSRSL